MKQKIRAVFQKAKQSKNRCLSIVLAFAMVLTLFPMVGMTAEAAVEVQPQYHLVVFDSEYPFHDEVSVDKDLNGDGTWDWRDNYAYNAWYYSVPATYEIFGSDSVAEDFGRTYYFAGGTPQSRGHASITKLNKDIYEGDTIYLLLGIYAGAPPTATYMISYNYNGGTTTEYHTTLSGIKEGLTEFKIPYGYNDITITVLDGASSHPTNPENGNQYIYALNIPIKQRSTSIPGVGDLVALINGVNGKVFNYTGQPIKAFGEIDLSLYFDVTGTTVATNVGTYTATLTPKYGYKWSDGTDANSAYGPRTVTWSIQKGAYAAPAVPVLTKTNNTITVANLNPKQLYQLNGGAWMDGVAFAASLTGLAEGTAYTVSTKVPGDTISYESPVVSATVTTDVTVTGKVNGTDMPPVVKVGGYTATVQPDGTYSAVVPVGSYTVTATGKDGLESGSASIAVSATNKVVPEITMAKTPKGEATDFVNKHLTGADGVYTVATDDNYNDIIGGEAEWNTLSPEAKNLVNAAVAPNNYPAMLAEAKKLRVDAKIGDVEYEHLSDALAAVTAGQTIELQRNPKKDVVDAELKKDAAIQNLDGSVYKAVTDGTTVDVTTVDGTTRVTLKSGTLNCTDTNGAPVDVMAKDGDTVKKVTVSSTEAAYDVTVGENGSYATFPEADKGLDIDGVTFKSDKAGEAGKLYLPNPLAAEGEDTGKITAEVPAGKSAVTKDGVNVEAPATNTGKLLVTNENVTVEKNGEKAAIDGKEYTVKADNTVLSYGEKGKAPNLESGAVELDNSETIMVDGVEVKNTGDKPITVTSGEPAKITVPAGGKVTIDGTEYVNDGTTPLEIPLDAEALDFIEKYLSDKNGVVYNEVTDANYRQIVDGMEEFEGFDQSVKDAINGLLKADSAKNYNSYAEYFALADELCWDAVIDGKKYEHLSDALAAVKEGETVELLRHPKKDASNAPLKNGASLKNLDGAVYTAMTDDTTVDVNVLTDADNNEDTRVTLRSGKLRCADTNGAPVGVSAKDGDTVKDVIVSSNEPVYNITVGEDASYVTFPGADKGLDVDGVTFKSDKAGEAGKLYLPNPLAAEGEDTGKITAEVPAGKSAVTKAGVNVEAPATNTGKLLVTNETVTVEKDGDKAVIGDAEYTVKADDTVLRYGEDGGAPVLESGAVELDKNEVISVGGLEIENTGDAEIVITAGEGDAPATIDIPAGEKVRIGENEYTGLLTDFPLDADALDFINTYLSNENRVYNEVNAANYEQIASGKGVYDGLSDVSKNAIEMLLGCDDADKYNSYASYLAHAEAVESLVDAFVESYLSDGDVEKIYTAVRDENYAQILSGEEAWAAFEGLVLEDGFELGEVVRDAINKRLSDAGANPDNYPDMLSAAYAQEADINEAADAFVRNYLTGPDGKVYTGVTEENYQQIYSGLDTWNGLSDVRRKAIDDRLKAAGANPDNYLDMLKLVQEKLDRDNREAQEYMERVRAADKFIADYLTDKDGNIYKAVNKGNYAKVLSGVADWNKLTDEVREEINKRLAPTTYEEMLKQAGRYVKSPKTGDNMWLVMMSAIGAGLIMTATLKRKKNEQ